MTIIITCLECNKKSEAQRSHKKFCDNACKTTFHNRAMKRGKELYHFMMIKRYDRKGADGFNEKTARQVVDALLHGYRTADGLSREGRPSWLPLEEALCELNRLPGCEDGR